MTLSDVCTVSRKDGHLILTIPEVAILKEVGTEEIPFARVTDPDRLLDHVVEHIRHTLHEHEDYETNLDHLAREALRSAEEVQAGITNTI